MFVDHGLSGMEISWLFTVWVGTAILLEVPSGVLADRHSRRFLLFVPQWFAVVGSPAGRCFPASGDFSKRQMDFSAGGILMVRKFDRELKLEAIRMAS